MTTLAQDTFTGTDQTLLSAHTAEVGGTYSVCGGSEANIAAWLVSGEARFHAVGDPAYDWVHYVLGSVAAGDATITAAAYPRASAAGGFGGALARRSSNNWYMAFLSSSFVYLYRVTSGTMTLISSLNKSCDHFRFSFSGVSPTALRVRAWTGTEPGTWDVDTTNNQAGNQVASGGVGVSGWANLDSFEGFDDQHAVDDFLVETAGGNSYTATAGDSLSSLSEAPSRVAVLGRHESRPA